MCIIIDANFASEIFCDHPSENVIHVVNWLFTPNKDGAMVLGGKLSGKLKRELFLVSSALRSIRVLAQAGRAFYEEDSTVDQEEQLVIQSGLCVSDDPHVIALARVSGARTLCSYDTDLHIDFKNKSLVDVPRGSIYQKACHQDLLRHTTGCKRPK
jgi:hypothetical protein